MKLGMGDYVGDPTPHACAFSVRISEINENELFVFVCVFTQSGGHEEQPRNLAMPRASTSAAADAVNTYTYCFHSVAR